MRLLMFAAVAVIGTAPGVATAANFFNDEAAFNAATAGFVFTLDPFDNDIAAGPSITFDSGVVSEAVGGGSFFTFGDNSVSGGVFNVAVDGDGDDAAINYLWTLPVPVTALHFEYLNVNPDVVNLSVGGDVRALRESADNDPSNGFFGVTSATPFSLVQFGGFGTNLDIFNVDNLAFGSATVVPLPAGLPLMAVALGGLGLMARRRARA